MYITIPTLISELYLHELVKSAWHKLPIKNIKKND